MLRGRCLRFRVACALCIAACVGTPRGDDAPSEVGLPKGGSSASAADAGPIPGGEAGGTGGAIDAGAMPDAALASDAANGIPTVPDASTDAGVPSCGSLAADAEVLLELGTWVVRRADAAVYESQSMLDAMRAAVASLTPGRAAKERVVVRDSGAMPANESLDLPSRTIFESCGTIEVTGTPTGDNAVVRARNVTDVEVPYLSVTGGPYFGIFVRNGERIHLGQIDLRLSGGLGVRIDNHSNRDMRTRDVRIDHVYVEGSDNQGVETYGVDGLVIGTVVARKTAFSGLLLNDTIHAEIGLVDAIGAGTGTGYAAFRMANRNGRVDDAYPTNIHVGEVRAQGGGRGIFCVSESGGAVIDRVEITEAGTDPAIFIEDCYNVTIAAEGGSVTRGAATHPHRIRITARPPEGSGDLAGFLGYSDGITIQNLAVTGSPISESPCGALQGDNAVRDNTLVDSPLDLCPGTDQGGN